MKKVLLSLTGLIIITGLAACVSSGYNLRDYQSANIAKDGVYKFSNPRNNNFNLLIKISTYKDKKDGSMKKKFMMLNISKRSNISNFNGHDKDVIVWPFYSINKNIVSTRVYERGNFRALVRRHTYSVSAGNHKGEVGFSYKLDFSKARFMN